MTKAEKAAIQKAINYVKNNDEASSPGVFNIYLGVVCMAAQTLIDTQPTMGEFQRGVTISGSRPPQRDPATCQHHYSDRTIPATCIHCGAGK